MLRHYFDEYKISVITDFPLADILHNRDATGRILKWPVELGAIEINFKARTAIKSEALCWRPKLANTEADRSGRLGRPVRPVWACAV